MSPFLRRGWVHVGRVWLLLTLLPQLSVAQDVVSCDTPERLTLEEVRITLQNQYSVGCLGGDRDATDSAALRAWSALDQSEPDDMHLGHEARVNGAQTVLTLIQRDLESAAEASAAASKAAAESLFREMAQGIAVSSGVLAADPDHFEGDTWQPQFDTDIQFLIINDEYAINLDRDLGFEERCAESPTACREVYLEAADGLRFAHLAELLFGFLYEPYLHATHEEARVARLQWDQYFETARSQYLWELVVNDRLYRAPSEGFPQPPSSQIILFHPSASLEYVNSGESRLQPLLTVELLGYNFWRWRGETMGPALGISAVMNVSDRSGYDTLSWGVMAHVNHRYSVGVARAGGSTDGGSMSLLVSLDVGEFFSSRSRRFQEIRDRIPWP